MTISTPFLHLLSSISVSNTIAFPNDEQRTELELRKMNVFNSAHPLQIKIKLKAFRY